jgi:hypothetical protein
MTYLKGALMVLAVWGVIASVTALAWVLFSVSPWLPIAGVVVLSFIACTIIASEEFK